MRGHDTYFPNCREICIMSPYSAVCLDRFVDAAEGGIEGFQDKRKAGGQGGAALLRRERGELRTSLCFNLLKHGDVRV